MPHARPTRILVVVPTYDEADALPLLVAALERDAIPVEPRLEVLVVDDASPDGTGRLADALAASRPWLHVLHRTGKDGLGAAYRAGFAWGAARGYDALGQMDADLQHPPAALVPLAAALDDGAALAVGSRYVAGGGVDGWSRSRHLRLAGRLRRHAPRARHAAQRPDGRPAPLAGRGARGDRRGADGGRGLRLPGRDGAARARPAWRCTRCRTRSSRAPSAPPR